MFVTLDIDQFNINNIFTSEKTKNNILNNSDFYRLYFSNEELVLNGVFINFYLTDVSVERYFNKMKCCFSDLDKNIETIKKIINIEKNIIEKCSDINKKGSYRIEEQMSNQFIKIYDQGNINTGKYQKLKILLKISGIWSNNINKEYGLTFRFFINEAIE